MSTPNPLSQLPTLAEIQWHNKLKRAFNSGRDSARQKKNRNTNPYSSVTNRILFVNWEDGYGSVRGAL